MIEAEEYCPVVMKQVSALQAALERVNHVLLQNHLETCVPHAIAEGRGEQIVAELMESLKYTSAVTGPATAVEEDFDESRRTSARAEKRAVVKLRRKS